MKNPVIPYAIIAVIGVLAVIIISYVGADQREALQNEEEGGTEVAEGEVSTDPEAVFSNNCAACHGADLSGGMGPDLTTIGSKYSSDEIVSIIQNGQGGMPAVQMPAEEASLLADWLSEKQ
ncbi:cytochrome c550 [Oceanobacillus bengalensis]|uniref:Cytochrome c n=1 Tax=Oceanobacillus bengalensis TaxID=1435466 RepID=A0A494Z752_9BACI|nr:cytochrome c [Oceanobacillus bengalensis]RKQ17836.1 cytochrome c [Oceanobacillus bengalensis]